MGQRVAATAWSMLRFPESKTDFFEFPRVFKPTKRALGRLQPFIGTWEGPTQKQIPLKKHRPITRVLVVLVIALELVPLLQIAAVAFLPVVPWPMASRSTAEFLRLLLLHPLWSHSDADKYPQLTFYFAVAVGPALLILACLLGAKRFPLFKPQPKSSPAEDPCTLALRAFSSWIVLPACIALLMPWACFFIGYSREGSWVKVPMYDAACFTWVHVGHASLGFATIAAYSLIASGIAMQLNCESSFPQPTLWTDARYTHIVHTLHAPLALSVIVFGNSNPLALCICTSLAGACLVVLNVWMWPCLFSLINWLRLYGALLATWAGVVGIMASIVDDPLTKSTYEIWSLGAIALSAVTFSSLFVHYSEEFWFKLSLFKGNKQQVTSAAASSKDLVKPTAASKSIKKSTVHGTHGDDAGAKHSGITTSTARHGITFAGKTFKPKLPPLHVMKKRSRRSVL